MKNFKYILFITLLAYSCTTLEEDPESLIATQQFYKTQKDAIAAVNAVYYQLNAPAQTPYNVLFSTGMDMMSDDVNPGPGATNADVRSQAVLGHSSSGLRVREIWQQHYGAINRANIAIDKIPGIPFDETLRARLVNEAKFLRALYYFNLVRLYGEVPIVLHEPTSLDKNDLYVEREPVEKVYEQIIADLIDAENLPASYTTSDVGRATSGAAKSLLAKVYLTREDWENAAQKAQEVITGPYGYNLFENYQDVFNIATENGKEHIFSVQFKSNSQSQGNQQGLREAPIGIPGRNGNYAEQPVFYKNGGNNAFSIYNLYSPQDKRREASFITEITSPTNGKVFKLATPHFNKYDDPSVQSNLTESGANVPIIRFSDVLLIHAEALNEKNGPTTEAYVSYNRIRKRAGLDEFTAETATLTQAHFRDSLYLDRRLELVFEYQRWFDLIRQKDASGNKTLIKNLHAAGKTNAAEKHFLFPIPQQEIDNNPKLTQNPGWE